LPWTWLEPWRTSIPFGWQRPGTPPGPNHWRQGGPRVPAHLLRSAALRDHWEELDRFEGAAYRRILVPFYSEQGPRAVGYLYAASADSRRGADR
jgi:hypothetical protein